MVKKEIIKLRDVKIPEGKDPKKYNITERKADIYWKIRETCNLKSIKQWELAEKYGVNQSQISRDFDDVKKDIKEEINKDITIEADNFWNIGIEKYVSDGDFFKANILLRDRIKLAQDVGALPKAIERVEISETETSAERIREAYKKYHVKPDKRTKGDKGKGR